MFLKLSLLILFSVAITLNSCSLINSSNPNKETGLNINYAKDGNIEYSEIKGFILKNSFIKLDTGFKDESIEGFKILKTKEDFDSYTKINPNYLSEGFKVESIDFSKNWVLVISKVTAAYSYEGKVSSLKMLNGELLAEYTYNIVYSSDNMGNDYIREVNSFTKIPIVSHKSLKINISKNSKITDLRVYPKN
ncbi:MAG: hypothetical protein U0354_05230 [Candidatus Sericytochromatia bacterium]